MKPAAVIGFGGYPTLPPLIAARFAGVPGIIHDANAVLGRANRFLSRHVRAIATSLPGVLDRDPALSAQDHDCRHADAARHARRRRGQLRAAGGDWPVPPAGGRRQPGRAHHERHRAAARSRSWSRRYGAGSC